MRLLLAAATILVLHISDANALCTTTNSTPTFPNPGGSVFGATAPQWAAYFGAKVDSNDGAICGATITMLPPPVNPQDAATKQYVDTHGGGGGGGGGLSGMTANQIPVAATATTVTSSLANSLTLGTTVINPALGGNAATLTGLTLITPAIIGGSLSGTLSGNVALSGNITLSALASSGTQCVQVSSTGLVSGTGLACGAGGGGITWPASSDIVVSNSTSTPPGIAPVNGSLLAAMGGAWVTTGALTANAPVLGGGTAVPTVGSRSGNTTEFATVTGSLTTGDLASWDTNGNAIDSGILASNVNTLSGAQIVSGIKTFSAIPVFSGLSSGTCSSGLAINATNQLVTTSCPAGSGLSGMTAGQVPIAASASSVASSHALTGTGLFIASSTGALPSGDCVSINGAGDFVDAGGPCTIGGGGGTVASSTVGQVPVYTGITTVTGNANLTFSGSTLTIGATSALGHLALTGNTSGSTIIQPAAIASGTLTLPSTTGTLVESAGSNTLGGTYNLTGTFQASGNAMTFPSSVATLASLNLAQSFSAIETFSATPVFSGLSSGTCNSGLAINSSNQLVTIACPAGSGISGLTSGQVAVAGSATTVTSSVAYGLTGNSILVETSPSGVIANSLISALPNANLAHSSVTIGSTSVSLEALY